MAFAYKRTWKTIGSYTYVDSWGGDDILGDGTADRPFQTINRAVLKNNIILLKGYFSEQVNIGNTFISDFMGDAIFDGKGIYFLGNYGYYGSGTNNGIIAINEGGTSSPKDSVTRSIIINGREDRFWSNGSYNVWDATKGVNISFVTNKTGLYSSFLNCNNSLRSSGSPAGAKCCIFDNCNIFLDVKISSLSADSCYELCLFRVNCTFWARKSDNTGDVRIDVDGQTAAQKYAAILNWYATGVLPSGYSKLPWVNCKITDNRIFNKPDGDTDGYNFDYSLIYGDKDNYPACYLDSGKHIGPFPPALKIAFKTTADLTSSPFEIEVKPTDKVVITGERLGLASDFAGCVLLSKPMPVPMGANFNNINLSVIPDTENKGVFVTPFDDAIDFSDEAKISPTVSGVPLSAGVPYFVKAGSAYVTYAGKSYQGGSIITAVDSTTLCFKSAGDTATLHPIYRPTIWNGTKMKIAESRDCPSDFLSNDAAYPWIDCKSSHSSGANTDDKIGMRCLRVGNLITGAVDVGTDGKPLTSAHPEFYSAANTSRAKFLLNVRWVILRLTITKYN